MPNICNCFDMEQPIPGVFLTYYSVETCANHLPSPLLVAEMRAAAMSNGINLEGCHRTSPSSGIYHSFDIQGTAQDVKKMSIPVLKWLAAYSENFGNVTPAEAQDELDNRAAYTASSTNPCGEVELPVVNESEILGMTPASTKPECWVLAEFALTHGRIIGLHGKPGTGKSTVANRVGETVYNVTLTNDTPMAELRGHFVPFEGGFKWMDGPALAAFRNGHTVVLNEVDHAGGEIHSFLLALLDDPAIAAYTLPTGETVRAHDTFRCVITLNGEPNMLPAPLYDRIDGWVHIDQPHPEAVASLPEHLRNIAVETFNHEDDERSISFRPWKKFAHLTKISGQESLAAKLVFGERGQEIVNALKIARAK